MSTSAPKSRLGPGFSEKPKEAHLRFAPFFAWLFAPLYGLAVSLIPWDLIRSEPYIDLATYIEGFESGAYGYLDLIEGPAYLLSEPAWRAMVDGLTTLVGSVSVALQLLTFCTSTVYAYVILRRSRIAALFLAGPLLIDLLVSQVRSAVAGAMFLIACLVGGTFLWLVVLLVGTLVHASILMLCGLYLLAYALSRFARIHPRLAQVTAICYSVGIPLLFAGTYEGLLGALGDRRVDSATAWPGGIFVITMATYYGAMLIHIRRVMMDRLAVYCLLISGLFVVLAFMQVNGLRFVSLTYPLFITTALALPFGPRLVVTTMLSIMCLYHFVLWI